MEKIKIAVIIAEFNPLHNGHKYIMDKARELTGCTHILVIQSGNFTQRAEPAIIDKYARAHAAILAGADAVVEIPAMFATGNAEIFAKSAVQIAASFPHVTHLVFGIEDKNLSVLKTIAEIQNTRKKDFEKLIKIYLKQGMSYDSARCEIIKKLLTKIPPEIISSTLKTPNNILALEYLKELLSLQSQITPLGVMRISNKYTDLALTGAISSATAIRAAIEKNEIYLPNYIPQQALSVTKDALRKKPSPGLFESIAMYNLRTNPDLKNVYNSNVEISNLVENLAPVTYEELKKKAPTKRFTVSRIARLALHSTLGITKKDMCLLYSSKTLPYTNLLAINEKADSFFATLCINAKTPLIVRGNKNKPKQNHYYKTLMRIDRKADLLYETICKTKFERKPVFAKPIKFHNQ